jgi:superfamily I DNA/RNA helicase
MENIEEVEELKPAARKSIQAFNEIFENLVKSSNKLVVSELIREIIKSVKYEEYITE